MAHTIQKEPVGGIAYDREEVRVRIKDHKFLFIGWEEIVKSESIKNELILNLTSLRMPDVIFFNGKEVTLTNKL